MIYVALPWLNVNGGGRRAGEFLSGSAKVDQQRLIMINVISCVFIAFLETSGNKGRRTALLQVTQLLSHNRSSEVSSEDLFEQRVPISYHPRTPQEWPSCSPALLFPSKARPPPIHPQTAAPSHPSRGNRERYSAQASTCPAGIAADMPERNLDDFLAVSIVRPD